MEFFFLVPCLKWEFLNCDGLNYERSGMDSQFAFPTRPYLSTSWIFQLFCQDITKIICSAPANHRLPDCNSHRRPARSLHCCSTAPMQHYSYLYSNSPLITSSSFSEAKLSTQIPRLNWTNVHIKNSNPRDVRWQH
jgi:hypothetical protein